MKKIIYLAVFLMALTTTSCTKEWTAKKLTNTTWRCSDIKDATPIEYGELRFVSETSVEYWLKYQDASPEMEVTMLYTIDKKTITLKIKKEDDTIEVVDEGVIEGNSMTFLDENEEPMVFTKQ
ncbi:MAG: hypothetical protein CSA89_01105 [Bacteroidales bacterium]|nr:MAG: hypothetical protein CSA89_01105 [Bacteroidales bacterium]